VALVRPIVAFGPLVANSQNYVEYGGRKINTDLPQDGTRACPIMAAAKRRLTCGQSLASQFEGVER
jgi:hypothetical protein